VCHRLVTKPFCWLLAILAAPLVFAPARATFAHPQHPEPGASPAHPQGAPSPPAQATAQAPAQARTQTAAPAPVTHVITVRFDYDFDRTPACSSSQPKSPCVQQFVVYDVSSGPLPTQRTQLFTIPLPSDPKGRKRRISQPSPPLLLERGRHMIAVTAQMPDNKTESFPGACTVWIFIR
jgi:hypothetical protein